MKIIKHILSHIGLIVVILCAVAVIYFRGELFPGYINEPVDTALNEIGDKLGIEIPSYNPEADGSAMDERYQVAVVNEVDQVPVENVVPESNVPDELSSDADPGMVTAITESVTQTVKALFSSDENTTGNAETSENENSSSDAENALNQPETLVSNTDESGGVKAIVDDVTNITDKLADSAGVSNDMELSYSRKAFIRARKAFWNGEFQEAEKVYMELTEHDEIDPNVYGELGNVYYAQGKWQEAGKAYYEAAIRLIELKQIYQVNYLLRVIQGLDSESAVKLTQKMSG